MGNVRTCTGARRGGVAGASMAGGAGCVGVAGGVGGVVHRGAGPGRHRRSDSHRPGGAVCYEPVGHGAQVQPPVQVHDLAVDARCRNIAGVRSCAPRGVTGMTAAKAARASAL